MDPEQVYLNKMKAAIPEEGLTRKRTSPDQINGGQLPGRHKLRR